MGCLISCFGVNKTEEYTKNPLSPILEIQYSPVCSDNYSEDEAHDDYFNTVYRRRYYSYD